MKKTKTIAVKTTLFTLASVLTATASFGAAWNTINNPTNFYRNYNVDPQGHPISNYNFNLAELPAMGVLSKENTPWSDSYWPKQLNGFAYRWQQAQKDPAYAGLTDAQRQAKFFGYHLYSRNELMAMNSTAEGRAMIDTLSPLEKYSIATGDYNYKVVRKFSPGQTWNHPSWEGYCHDWAPASTHYPEPARSTITNSDGIQVNFASSDVKALLMASYQESRDFGAGGWIARHIDPSKIITSYIGGGCDTQVKYLYPGIKMKNGLPEMATFPSIDGLMDADLEQNVRDYQANVKKVLAANPNSLSVTPQMRKDADNADLPNQARKAMMNPQMSCSGVNAGTFHVVVANQLGIHKVGFEMDKTADGEIWNQPVRGYSSKILSYGSPTATSAPGTVQVAVVQTDFQYGDDTDYGWSFVNPTVSGISSEFDLSKSVVSSDFASEYDAFNAMLARQGDAPAAYPANIIDTVHYKYTLDLDSRGNIIGGDWLSLDRPDTLWIMKKQEFSKSFSALQQIYKPAAL